MKKMMVRMMKWEGVTLIIAHGFVFVPPEELFEDFT